MSATPPPLTDEQLAERIAHALRTTPAAGWTYKPGEERWDHHQGGHRYSITCALCMADVDSLVTAVLAEVRQSRTTPSHSDDAQNYLLAAPVAGAQRDTELRDAVIAAITEDGLKPRDARQGLVEAMLAAVRPEVDRLRAERDQARAQLAEAKSAWRRLKVGLIATHDRLDVPFSNAPEQSPWTRMKPAMTWLDSTLNPKPTAEES